MKRVLIVDDEVDITELLAEVLGDEGYSVDEAHSGSEALDLLKKSRYDVVVSDIRMPEMSGVELLKEMRLQFANCPPVIFMTGFAEVDEAQAKSLGAECLLPKPLEFSQLLSIVKTLSHA